MTDKFAHNIKITVYINDEEDETKITNTFLSLIPLDLEKEKLSLEKTSVKGTTERNISILGLFIDKQRHIKAVLKNLKELLGTENCITLINQRSSRLDEHLHFYIRLDKQDLMNNKATLVDHGNCFHIKMTIAAYPAKREIAQDMIRDFFKQE